MGWKRPQIKLSDDVIARCERFGARLSWVFLHPLDSDSAAMKASRSVSSDGVESNPEALGQAKMAECAFCDWAGISIEQLNWKAREPDDGIDVRMSSKLIDVKHTKYADGCLIWPRRKNYTATRFNVLALVRGEPPTFEITGWVSRQRFYEQHRKDHPKLAPGTPFMPADCLDPISSLWLFEGR